MNHLEHRDQRPFEVVSFDCYGTLIDWETGLLGTLTSWLNAYGIHADEESLLEQYATFEAEAEKGSYRRYREILIDIMHRFAAHYRIPLTSTERFLLIDALVTWLPFPDVNPVLTHLKQNFKLAVISNIDRDLFEATSRHFKVTFDIIITAEDVRAYKPSLKPFQSLLDSYQIQPDSIIHVAQSFYHDIEPARAIGITTGWLNRSKKRKGFGATPPVHTKPDFVFHNLYELQTLLR